MPTTFTPPDNEFAAASGSNVNFDPNWSYFDNPPNSTKNLTITSNAGDGNPGFFETGETYDLTWQGNGGGGTMEDATIIRSDYLAPGEGAIVFEGINSNTGELFQMIWTPGFDLESWYWDNGGGPSSPNAFYTSDQDAQDFQYVCYAKGTLIQTPNGRVRIERLKLGDYVDTLDNGPKMIRWIRRDMQPLQAIDIDKKPVLIAAHALGDGRPEDDLVVSPQHRIFVGAHGQLEEHFQCDAFVPAKALTGLRGIRQMQGKSEVEWFHFAFDSHEVILANGCLSESLLLGATVVSGLSIVERRLLGSIFGPARNRNIAVNGPAARECLTVGAARQRIAKVAGDTRKVQVADEISKWDVDLAIEVEAQSTRMSKASMTSAA